MSVNDDGLDQGQLSQIQNELSVGIPKSWVLTTLGDPFKWGSGGTSQEQKAGETTAKTLIQAGARINEKISTHETTVIFEVARFNRPDIVH